jgi:hypothetical protein
MKTRILVGAALLLAGCADMPLGWGDPEKVLFSDPNTLQLQWSSWRSSEAAVRSKAVLHCNGRRVEEGDESRHDRLGIIRSKTWRCVGV